MSAAMLASMPAASSAAMSEDASLPEPNGEPPGNNDGPSSASSASSVESGTVESAGEPPDDELDASGDSLDTLELAELEPAELELAELLDSFVSANETAGIDAIAAPTPKATARAPTRPTQLEYPDGGAVLALHSIRRIPTAPIITRGLPSDPAGLGSPTVCVELIWGPSRPESPRNTSVCDRNRRGFRFCKSFHHVSHQVSPLLLPLPLGALCRPRPHLTGDRHHRCFKITARAT